MPVSDTTLVVAAHPDDEALGAGGTVAKWSDAGVIAHVAFLADGTGARTVADQDAEAVLAARRTAADRALKGLGVTDVHYDDLPDNALDSLPLLEVTQRVEALIDRYQPQTVLTHHAGDLNVDHRIVHQAVMTACRPQAGHPVHRILCFEVASSTEWQPPGSGAPFSPNVFVDISATLEQKLDALRAYSMEMRDWPHPRSLQGVEHLARWRGATVGVEAAEAFVLARGIE